MKNWNTILFLTGIYLLIAVFCSLFLKHILQRLFKCVRIKIEDYVVKILHIPVILSVLLVGVYHIYCLFNPFQRYSFIILGLIKSLIILIWSFTFFRIVRELARRKFDSFFKTGKLTADFVILIKNLSYAFIVIATISALLKIWQVDLSPILASAGIAGIAIALAARETLSNFFGGISIFLDRTYKVGDYIILDSGERGEVVDVGIRSTRIKTRDDVIITIPNSIMANSKIINESAPEPRFRLRLPIGVSYSSDLEKVERVLLEIVRNVPHIVKNPEPRVRYRQFGESSIDLELLCWVDDPRNRGPVTHELIKKIHKTFQKEGIVIPFPQRDIHFYKGN